VRALGYPSGTIAVDEATPFFTFDGLRRAGNAYTFVNAVDVTAGCRMIKSEHELALMQTAKNITLEAHRRAARIMREGITTTEVQAFLTAAHRKLGSEGDPPFNAVLFGEASAYPHGVPYPQTLKDGDMILIDTGAPVDGYLSDITAPTCSANRPSASARSGTWKRRRRPRDLPRPNPATAARTSTSPRGASSTAPVSGRDMRHRGCPTAPDTALGSTCTNGPIW
jgi:Xaa-Pro aminopeptidase